jgi:signal transduction histidine kinase
MKYRVDQIIAKIITLPWKQKISSEEIKIVYIYRYLSWAITSCIYLLSKPYSVFLFKLGVIISLFLSTMVISELYVKFRESIHSLKALIIIETIGITFLLLPTGGLDSPFIWYALNPTLTAASYLSMYFCWANLSFYLLVGTIMTYYMFNPNHKVMMELIAENSNLILVFLLITLAVHLMANLSKNLSLQAHALKISNQQKQESMEHIMALYQVIEAIDNNNSKEKLFEVLVNYAGILTKSESGFLWIPNEYRNDDMLITSKLMSDLELQNLLSTLKSLNLSDCVMKSIQKLNISGNTYMGLPILSTNHPNGLIAVLIGENTDPFVLDNMITILDFLSGLCSVTLERFYIEDLENHLLVLDEQNRIANEIHDNVSQRLFSIAYSTHGLLKQWDSLSNNDLYDTLSEIEDSANCAMKELRNSIYKLSSKKRNENSWQISLQTFFNSLIKLHHISIQFNIKGDEHLLSLSIKQILSRILRETCGNAIRHGKCTSIDISTVITNEEVCVTIIDNGTGFDCIASEAEYQSGLGLSNIRNLVTGNHGKVKIDSTKEKGTRILIILPLVKDLTSICRKELFYETNIS